MTNISLAYPIGRFEAPAQVDEGLRSRSLDQIGSLPALLQGAVGRLSDRQLDTPYREGGWTVRQVVHHLPDSHLHAYQRFKRALTETEPVVQPYPEAVWAELPEARTAPIAMSLTLLEGLHQQWVACARALPAEAFARTFRHPEVGVVRLDQQLVNYAWHGRHHLAQVAELVRREGWG